MSEAAVPIEDFGYRNLRMVADRLLETTRVEYVDEGVLPIMNPPGIEHRRIVRGINKSAARAYYSGAISVDWEKPVEYAKAGVPLYLLVDQELVKWMLHGLAEGWQRYQVVAVGSYGDEIRLPAPLGFSIETADWPRWR